MFAFLEDVLLLRTQETESEREEHERFALRFQQLTGPVKAKAVEDTAFYRYNRLVVSQRGGQLPGQVRRHGRRSFTHRTRSARAPGRSAWSTTSTHDSKRGEDTSARIAVLSEMPEVWRRALRAVRRAGRGRARRRWTASRRRPAALEYLFYQTLLGAWPSGWDGRSNATA